MRSPLTDLTPYDGSALVAEAEYDTVELRGLDLTGGDGSLSRLIDVRIASCRLDEARMRRARLSECEVVDVNATALDVAESQWWDVRVEGGRYGALIAHGSTWRDVSVVGVRLDYLSLRGARLSDCRFERCRIGELDLGSATAERVVFADCEVDRLDLTAATLALVDLTGVRMREIADVRALSGARISAQQLLELAPHLAAEMGIEVVDGN